MKRQVVEPVDELVKVAAEIRNGSLWLHVDEESPKIAHTICDALPYLARQLSVFNRLPTEGYTQGGRFWVRGRRDQELEGARNTRLRQVRAARSVTPYVLYGLYCLRYRMT
jgi:hypothetical protein